MPTKTTTDASSRNGQRRLSLSLQIAARAAGIPSAHKLRGWAREVLQAHAQVTVRIVGSREGRALNYKYRGRDYATNVLTFAYAEKPVLCGDIALCAPVIRREALSQAKALHAHYAHLLVHALLHLQGHDHHCEREAKAMEARETAILQRLGYPDPYAAIPI